MYTQRIAIIQQELASDEAFLITGGVNRFYFTGFPSSAGRVLIAPDRAVLLIDSRYFEKAKATVTSCEVRLSRRPDSEVNDLCREWGIGRLYGETDVLSVGRFNALNQVLAIPLLADDRFTRLVATLRETKSAEELDCIRRAQAMTEETFSYILDRITPGRTERELALDMEFYMRRLGSEGVAFEFIAVSGKNSSLPHGVPTDKVIERGDFVTMDFGAVCRGYRSDMTRTVAVGEVSAEQRLVYDTVLQAQQAALAAVRPGAVCRDIDKIARDIIGDAGYGDCFGHGLGHSVGLEIHEMPSFAPSCDAVLHPGMVMTVEPGIYLENRFGVRIEDMVAVTEAGYINLTSAPKELLIL